jgi:hypothetical protein
VRVGVGGVQWTIRLWRTGLFFMGVSKVALEYRLRGVFSTHRFNNQPNQQRTLAAARLTHHHFGTPPVFRNNSVPRSG